MNRTIVIGALLAAMLAGCKPTEKNYQAAYDAARAKREAAAREEMLPAQGLQSDDGPQLRILNGDTVYVLRARLRTEDSKQPGHKWLLAVGVYKMNTNAKTNAENLRQEGYAGATWLRGPENKWYAVASGASTLDSVHAMATDFRKKHPRYPYVGLPASPVIIGN